jgi:hypothetical protein
VVIASNFVPNQGDDTVDVEFDNVPTTANYTLAYVDADGNQSTIIDNASFSSLQDNTHS